MVDQCKPDPVEVKVVEDQTAVGVPNQTIWQWLVKQGIVPAQAAELPGSYVQGFQQTLDASLWLKPIVRESFANTSAPAVSLATVTQILGVKQLCRVIRALAWQVNTETPDITLISFEAQSGIGEVPWIRQDSSFPSSGLIVGDVRSLSTSQFNRHLPLVLLPGDKLIFKASQAPAKLWDSQVSAWIEDYPLPLRPAGL